MIDTRCHIGLSETGTLSDKRANEFCLFIRLDGLVILVALIWHQFTAVAAHMRGAFHIRSDARDASLWQVVELSFRV